MENISGAFLEYSTMLQSDSEVRDKISQVVKQLDDIITKCNLVIQKLHRQPSGSSIEDVKLKVCNDLDAELQAAKGPLSKLNDLYPQGDYYRHHDLWRSSLQRIVFMAAIRTFLASHEGSTGQLITWSEAAEKLGLLGPESDGGLPLDLEEFLLGLLQLGGELTRLSFNCVTHGDYQTPRQIAHFLSDLEAGFRLLNFKNDMLRRKYDGLKYDLRKVEEVVYDISIRRLAAGDDA